MATQWDVLSSGAYVPSESQLPSQPVDTAGGAPGNYGQSVLDLFKFGIGAWSANKAQSNAIDYLQWQTVNGRPSVVGQPSVNSVDGAKPAGGMSATTMLLIGGAVLAALLVLKKVA